MKLRLLLFEDCDKNCPQCCNKNFDLDTLPAVESFRQYEEILLTGGEPMLHPQFTYEVAKEIKRQTNAPVFMYTAKVNSPKIIDILCWLEGITITLHSQQDVPPFYKFARRYYQYFAHGNHSIRVKIFDGVNINQDAIRWNIEHAEWIKDCPLPYNEVFKRVTPQAYKRIVEGEF